VFKTKLEKTSAQPVTILRQLCRKLLSETLLLVKMKEKKLLKVQSLQKVLRVQAISNYVYNCYKNPILIQARPTNGQMQQNPKGLQQAL
jgi:hypothetical protein